ncbi:MAG: ABC transporter permease [Pseudonocardia sp.]|nr:ABC transporter permease [Pseudonocardia sp.]
MNVLQFVIDNAGVLVEEALGTLLLSAVSMAIAIAIGLPLGAWVGHLHRFSSLAINGSNVLRALPTLALVAIMIPIIGFGFANMAIALVVLGLPLILTNSFAAVEGVDPGIVEAARGMGMTDWQILSRVELPNAIPLIMTGIKVAWVFVVATAYLAVFAGSPGTLGDIIGNPSGYGQVGILGAALVSMALALLGFFLLGALERGIMPRGLTLARVAATAPA